MPTLRKGTALVSIPKFDRTILAQASRGVPTVILTNPSFAGVGDCRISDRQVLEQYVVAKKWENRDGEYVPTSEFITEGVPPEMLFFERVIDWLAPGRRIGIVLPKGFLDTATFLAVRHYMFQHCKILAVVNLHKNTFQIHTGVRTCCIVLQKYENDQEAQAQVDYPIFMAISRRVGQDSEGSRLIKWDDAGNVTGELDQDLDEIYKRYESYLNGELVESNYCFSVMKSDVNESLNINPQMYMPSLNATIKQVAQIGETEGWSVETLGQIHNDILIFKGPRLKSENLVTEDPDGPAVEPYCTPSCDLAREIGQHKVLGPFQGKC